jgi:predicted DNA-binding transcriptional regulator
MGYKQYDLDEVATKGSKTARRNQKTLNNRWTFLTNHARVFEYVATHKHCAAKTMSREIGITQRVVFMILKDLEKEGYITREKVGRCNHYEIHADLPMRHHLDKNRAVGELLPGWATEKQHIAAIDRTEERILST